MEAKKETKKRSNKGKYILIGLGVVAVGGIAAYFIANNNTSSQADLLLDELKDPITPPNNSLPRPSHTGKSTSGFPLKKGSRGTLVKNIQDSLIAKYGSTILPKWGADGQWGSELQNALISKSLPTTITTDDFKTIVTETDENEPSKAKHKFNPSLIATNLRLAILDDDFTKAKRVMNRIHTVKGYKAVSNEFKTKRINGVRKSVVNALLTKFWDKSEKKILNTHFYRIGLKFNGSQWSLSGLGELKAELLQTISKTLVWNELGKKLSIEKDTIIGEFVDAANGVTKFKTLDNQILFIKTKNIVYAAQ